MGDVTDELMYELLKRIPDELSEMAFDIHELKTRVTGAQEGDPQ